MVFALAGAATNEAAQRKIIRADTLVRTLRNSLVLVATENVQPPAASAAADIARLIAGKTVAIANPERDVAGAHAIDLLRKIGVAVDGPDRTIVVAESSAGVVSFLSLGFTGMEASVVAVAVLTALVMVNSVTARQRDRFDVGSQIADLSRGTADIGRQVSELDRRIVALEG